MFLKKSNTLTPSPNPITIPNPIHNPNPIDPLTLSLDLAPPPSFLLFCTRLDLNQISCKPTAKKKYDKAFNTDTSHLDWEKIYLLPFKTTLHTKLREFQYKILNRILYTNDMLFKFKKVDSPLCYFCGKELETLEHLFFCCPKVHVFWNEVAVMLNSHGITFKSLDIKDILFGFFDARNHDSGGSLLN